MEQLVAREAHNLEVVGSSPAPATLKAVSQETAFFYFLPPGRFGLKKRRIGVEWGERRVVAVGDAKPPTQLWETRE